MLKEYATFFRRLMMFVDICVIGIAMRIAFALTSRGGGIVSASTYAAFFVCVAFLWIAFFHFLGMYSSFRVATVPDRLLIILQTFLFTFPVMGSCLYLFKVQDINRLFVLLVFVTIGLAFSIEKSMLIVFFRHIRRRGVNYRSILVVGTGKRAQKFIDLINAHSHWGLKIVGLIDDDPQKKDELICGARVLGTINEIPEIVHRMVVDEVAFIVPRLWLDRIAKAVAFCEAEGLKIHIAQDLFDLQYSRMKRSELQGFPLLTIECTPSDPFALFLKRAVDVIVSALGLLLLLPFFIVLAAAIKATSRGPVFFKQKRCSLNGRTFTLYKFRTMVDGAEDKLNEVLAHNEMQGPAFKLSRDPRLTPIGGFLRRFSLDELAQLWNVLKGDMSLVGPRPPLPSEVHHYQTWQRRKLSMRPGITCLWQVNGRNLITDFNTWVSLDLKYIDTWSLWLDTKILAKTIPVVLLGRGAK